MGWTSYRATEYKANGTIDRKAECDKVFNWTSENKSVQVIKSAIVGATYYAAVEIRESEKEPCVAAMVCLTNVNRKEYYNFAYKDMSETMGPYENNCPKSILDLLTDTDDEYALAWRKRCRDNLAKKKDPLALCNLPLGTRITINSNDESFDLVKCIPTGRKKAVWVDWDKLLIFNPRDIERHGFAIV